VAVVVVVVAAAAALISGGRRVGTSIGSIKNNLLNVKVKFNLQQTTKAQRGSRGIALLFL